MLRVFCATTSFFFSFLCCRSRPSAVSFTRLVNLRKVPEFFFANLFSLINKRPFSLISRFYTYFCTVTWNENSLLVSTKSIFNYCSLVLRNIELLPNTALFAMRSFHVAPSSSFFFNRHSVTQTF